MNSVSTFTHKITTQNYYKNDEKKNIVIESTKHTNKKRLSKLHYDLMDLLR